MTQITLELSDDKLAELDQMAADCGLSDRKAVLNNALAMLEWVIRQVKQGRLIGAIDEHGQKYHEMSMPFFDNLKS